MKKAIVFLILILAALCCRAQDGIVGSWQGILEVPGAKLRLVFHIQKTADGYQTKMDSPDQNAKDIPTTSTTFKDSRLNISIALLNARYSGELTNGKIEGTFTQGQAFPLTLKQEETKIERPQEPKPPFPYHSEEVRFDNKQANITLAGTLTLPKKEGSYPAVVLISGSGPQNRDEEIMGHKPFLVLADHLTRQGIAVLRFDDRGTGASTGKFNNGTAADFATDAKAAVAYLKTRKEIKGSQIGLIGHSEGGMIAPMLAAGNREAAFIVLLAAPGVHCRDLWLKQIGDIANVQSLDEKKAHALVACYKEMAQILSTHPGDAAKPVLEKFLQTHLSEIVAGQALSPEQGKQLTNGMLQTLTQPWFRYFITYDPAPNLEKIQCPVLALNGSKDMQVNATQNLAGINKALTKAQNRNFKTMELKGLNHLFQECATGNPGEYGTLTQTFSPEALNIVATWIKEQTNKKEK